MLNIIANIGDFLVLSFWWVVSVFFDLVSLFFSLVFGKITDWYPLMTFDVIDGWVEQIFAYIEWINLFFPLREFAYFILIVFMVEMTMIIIFATLRLLVRFFVEE